MNAQTDLPRIPLDQLRLSPLNARKTNPHGVEDLAASIAAHGLLQNLTVTPGDEGFEVVAGGRRLAALQLLQRERRLPDGLDDVPCLVITDADVAHEASTAENTLREAMHPADQFLAFQTMIDAGKPIADVAAHFGVTELFVRQRLKLANVNPDLLQVYREDGMNLEQLQALALTDNHEVQRQAWFTAREDWERNPRSLRERITQKEVESDSALARFVGLNAYQAAGGPVRQDLFSDRGAAWLQDRALLEKLALEQLEAIAEQERQAGWSWAEAHLHIDYSQRAEYARHPQLQTLEGVLTPAQQRRVDEILDRQRTIEQLPDDSFDEESMALDDELKEIYSSAEPAWPEELKSATGVLVFIDHSGVQYERARLRPGQKADKAGAVTGTSKPSKAAEPAAKGKKPDYSAAILNVLSAHRSEVARFHVTREPQFALALAIDFLLSKIRNDYAHADLLHLSGTTVPDARGAAPDIHKALTDESRLPIALFKNIPRNGRLTWLIKQPQADLLKLFAYVIGQHFGGHSERPEGHRGVGELHAAIAFDMADYWDPTCDNFLARIPAALVVQAVTEAKGKAAAAALSGLKKDALVAEAAKQLAGTGYLPKTLRGPTYALRGEAKATPAKKAAKAPAKKPAKKKPAARKPTSKNKGS